MNFHKVVNLFETNCKLDKIDVVLLAIQLHNWKVIALMICLYVFFKYFVISWYSFGSSLIPSSIKVDSRIVFVVNSILFISNCIKATKYIFYI
jgi:hypothetical protein